MSETLTVLSDMRWPSATGIGQVMEAVVSRKPETTTLRSLPISGSIGSPLSPVRVAGAIGKAGCGDVFWSAGFIPPAWGSTPAVVTVHDLTHLHYYGPTKRIYYETFLRPIYRRAAAIVCVSDFTRDEFLNWSGIDGDRVYTVHNGVNPAFLSNQSALKLPYRYILYPGNHRSYKNLRQLVKGYAASSLPKLGVHLAMTGKPNPEISALAAELGVQDCVHALGFIEQADLPALYRGAEAIAYVSLYEGFGLPIVEGMASGTPVLTSNVSAMPEVAGEAAVVVDPTSIEAIGEGLDRIIGDTSLRAGLSAKGLKRVAQFDWNRAAAKVWNIVEQVRR